MPVSVGTGFRSNLIYATFSGFLRGCAVILCGGAIWGPSS